jgi:hypothetical protein
MREWTNDPVIDEVREVRHQISARFGHDPRRLVAYYLEKQEADEAAKKKSSKGLIDGSSGPTAQAVEAGRKTL